MRGTVEARMENFFGFQTSAAWEQRRTEEEDYHEIALLGPRNGTDTFSATLVVSATTWPGDEPLPRLKDKAREYVEKARRLSEFQEISSQTGSLAGEITAEAEISYLARLPLHSVRTLLVRVHEKQIFCLKNSRLYEITYMADDLDYQANLGILTLATQTFKFFV